MWKSSSEMEYCKFIVGCELEEFERYYKRVKGDLGVTEKNIVIEKRECLILLKEGHQILSNAIWHESNMDEHRRRCPEMKWMESYWRNFLEVRRILLNFMNFS